MVGTGDVLIDFAESFIKEDGASVSADIGESAQGQILAAYDDDGLVCQRHREVVTRFWKFAFHANEYPLFCKDLSHLFVKHT